MVAKKRVAPRKPRSEASKKAAKKKAEKKRAVKKAIPKVIRSKSSSSSVMVGSSSRTTGSAVALRVGGREYTPSRSSGCITCNSPHRLQLETGMAKGWSIAAIFRRVDQENLPEGEKPVNPQSLRNHWNNHMGLDRNDISYAMAESWSNKLGRDLETEESVVTHLGAIEAVLQKGFEGIASGKESVSAKDTLSAAKLMLEFEGKIGGGTDPLVFLQTLQSYIEVSRDFVDPDRMGEFSRAIDNHPLIQGMVAQLEAADPVLEEIEIIEDSWDEDDVLA